jgi:hypothetical protein
MSLSQAEANLPALGAHARAETGELLQRSHAELIALSLMGKQLHWNLTGPGSASSTCISTSSSTTGKSRRTWSRNARSRSGSLRTDAHRP